MRLTKKTKAYTNYVIKKPENKHQRLQICSTRQIKIRLNAVILEMRLIYSTLKISERFTLTYL